VKRQTVICIGGAHSGCGKTTVAENLLRLLGGSWGAIKYTKTAFYTSVRRSPEAPEDKDTSRLRRAGAGDVLWVQAPDAGLEEPMDMAVNLLAHCEGIVVEGNSPIEFLSPDIVIFVFGKDIGRLKPSALRIVKKADIVIYQDEIPSSDPSNREQSEPCRDETIHFDIKERACFHKLKAIIMNKIEKTDTSASSVNPTDNVTKEETSHIETDSPVKTASNPGEELLRHVKDKRIPCKTARKIAVQTGLSYHEIGKLADELDIKITDCELGCF
jgi:ABC-type oligopeptide transport system ATPase subunit